jgi:hypothetical protein
MHGPRLGFTVPKEEPPKVEPGTGLVRAIELPVLEHGTYKVEYLLRPDKLVLHYFRPDKLFPMSIETRIHKVIDSWPYTQQLTLEWIPEVESWCVMVTLRQADVTDEQVEQLIARTLYGLR